jgi:hypothetical protein
LRTTGRPAKAFQAAVLPQFGRHIVEAWLQLLWGNLVQQNTDTAGAKIFSIPNKEPQFDVP